MIQEHRDILSSYFSIGILRVTKSFYEKEYNPSLDIIPKIAADVIFCAASIGYEVYGKEYVSPKNKEVQLVIGLAIPLILQMGIYFLVCKVRGVSHKVWFATIAWKSVEHVIDTIISYTMESLHLPKTEKVQSLKCKVSGVVKFFTTSSYLSNAHMIRSPHLPISALLIPQIGHEFSSDICCNKKNTSEVKFWWAPAAGLGVSWVAHYVLQKISLKQESYLLKYVPLKLLPQGVEGPFLWKIELAQQGVSTIAGWFFHSVDSPLYTPSP